MYPFIQSFEAHESEYPHFGRILQLLAESPVPSHAPSDPDNSFTLKVYGNKSRIRKFWFAQACAQGTASYRKSKTSRVASSIQEHGLRLLKHCRFVESYVVQPGVIQYTLDGQVNWCLPDVAVECTNGQMCFVNFMPRAALNNSITVKRSQLLAMKLPSLGYRYLVVIPEQVRRNSRKEVKSPSTALPLVGDCK